ncbi:MAG: T9SS type A sorting domain-containing protein, partial [Bacteroidales bacterium]
ISSKEEADIMFFENLDEEMNNYTPTKNGFNAGQLAEHFPELVETDKDENSYIDYTGLIPVLVEAIKEQSRVMRAQSMKIKEMELMAEASSINTLDSDIGSFSTKSMLDTNSVDRITTNAFLYQNTPNPFNTTTEIKYFLPEGSTNAYIYVFNMQGNLLLTHNLNDNGFGSVLINGSSLTAGMYIYSLVINGQEAEAETKRMILTK